VHVSVSAPDNVVGETWSQYEFSPFEHERRRMFRTRGERCIRVKLCDLFEGGASMLHGVTLSSCYLTREFGDHDVKRAAATERDSVGAAEDFLAAQ